MDYNLQGLIGEKLGGGYNLSDSRVEEQCQHGSKGDSREEVQCHKRVGKRKFNDFMRERFACGKPSYEKRRIIETDEGDEELSGQLLISTKWDCESIPFTDGPLVKISSCTKAKPTKVEDPMLNEILLNRIRQGYPGYSGIVNKAHIVNNNNNVNNVNNNVNNANFVNINNHKTKNTEAEWVIEKNPGPGKKQYQPKQKGGLQDVEVSNNVNRIISLIAFAPNVEKLIGYWTKNANDIKPTHYALAENPETGQWYIYFKFEDWNVAKFSFDFVNSLVSLKSGKPPVVRKWSLSKARNINFEPFGKFKIGILDAVSLPARKESNVVSRKVEYKELKPNQQSSPSSEGQKNKEEQPINPQGKVNTPKGQLDKPVVEKPQSPIEIKRDPMAFDEEEEFEKNEYEEELRGVWDKLSNLEELQCTEAASGVPVKVNVNHDIPFSMRKFHESKFNEEGAREKFDKLFPRTYIEYKNNGLVATIENINILVDDELTAVRDAIEEEVTYPKAELVEGKEYCRYSGVIKQETEFYKNVGRLHLQKIVVAPWLNLLLKIQEKHRYNFRTRLNPFILLKIDTLLSKIKILITIWSKFQGVKCIKATGHNEKSKIYDFNHRRTPIINLPILKHLTEVHIHSEFQLESNRFFERKSDVRFKMNSHGDHKDSVQPDLCKVEMKFVEVKPVLCGIVNTFKTTIRKHTVSRTQVQELRAPANVVYYDGPEVVRERQKRFHMKSSYVNIDRSNVLNNEDVHNHSMALAQYWGDHRRWHDKAMISQMTQDSYLN
jgi:hypothetical protein